MRDSCCRFKDSSIFTQFLQILNIFFFYPFSRVTVWSVILRSLQSLHSFTISTPSKLQTRKEALVWWQNVAATFLLVKLLDSIVSIITAFVKWSLLRCQGNQSSSKKTCTQTLWPMYPLLLPKIGFLVPTQIPFWYQWDNKVLKLKRYVCSVPYFIDAEKTSQLFFFETQFSISKVAKCFYLIDFFECRRWNAWFVFLRN